MRKVHVLFVTILLTFSLSVYSIPVLQTDKLSQFQSTINYSYYDRDCCDFYINPQLGDTNIYKLITTGKETEIRKYFRAVTLDELAASDSATIIKALNRLNTNDKVTRTIWILEEVKNRNLEIKRYVYLELGKVAYNKPPFFLKQMINNYFTNFHEKEDTLLEMVSVLQKRMNKR